MGVLELYRNKKLAQQPQAVVQPIEQPKVDTGNAMGSLAQMLGPTPAEREARDAAAEKHKQKMLAWGGLFDGLRHLGNLYGATKGGNALQLTNSVDRIEQQAAADRKRRDENDAYRRAYATQLYNINRQAAEEARKAKLVDAQVGWYKDRGDAAQQKAELDRLKAVKVIKNPDGSLIKYDPVSGETEQLKESDPLYVEWKRSQINRNNRTGGGSGGRGKNNGTYGYEIRKHTDPATGDVITTRIPTTGNSPEKAPADRRETTTVVKKNNASKQNTSVTRTSKSGKETKTGKGTTGSNRSGFFNK